MVYLNPSHAHSNGGSGSSGKNGVDSHNGHHDGESPFTSLNNASDASSGDEEREGRIRVGKDYQAMTPPYIPQTQRRPEQCPERALLVWSPAPQIVNTKLDEYVQVAKEKYGYNAEQALGMLFWHKHDLDRAVQDLANFTPFPDEWSVEDKVLFEQAFQFHGKSFHRIRQMLPDKSIAQLVKYYYGWKKTRTRTSLMDRQARKLQAVREEQGSYGEEAANEESEVEDEKESAQQKPKCFNCGILCNITHTTAKGQMCGTCHQYFARTGHVRPTTGPSRKDGTKSKHSIFKNSNQPPKGMYINHDDLVELATGPVAKGDAILKAMDREIVSYKRTVQVNKQLLSVLQRRTKVKSVDPYRIPDLANKLNARWTNDELLLGVQGIRKFGKNFKTIADVIGTKTESHVRSFYVNYRRRYNLDAALKEYEAEHGPTPADDDEMRLDSDPGTPINGADGASNPDSPSRAKSPVAAD